MIQAFQLLDMSFQDAQAQSETDIAAIQRQESREVVQAYLLAAVFLMLIPAALLVWVGRTWIALAVFALVAIIDAFLFVVFTGAGLCSSLASLTDIATIRMAAASTMVLLLVLLFRAAIRRRLKW